jgi:M6 family metalloprotease-like protein
MTRRTLLAAAVVLAAAPAGAQDIEALSAATGIPLPRGYYERVRRDPHFFEPKREWQGRAAPRSASGEASVERPVVRGDLRMVVMMGLFADSGEPPVSAGTVHEQLFGDNPLGSLTDYYRETSGGVMSIQGTVLPWVRTRFNRAQTVGSSYGLGEDSDLEWYLRETVELLDRNTNFAQYDNDGPDNVPDSGDDDGYVDLAVFQFAEVAASCGNPSSIWPHRSGLSGWLGWPYNTDDVGSKGVPIRIDAYHIQSAVNCDGTPQSIATIAHETGHAFGLGDYYDASEGLLPVQRRWVLGCWSLMAAGAWGCGDGGTFGKTVSPPHMSPYEKEYLGWLTPVVAEPGWRREYVLPPVQQSGRALMVPLLGGYEYLLLEYRTNTGFDSALPAGGVLVYHVDNIRQPPPGCGSCRIYRVGLVEADGDSALVKRADEGGNRGVAGDVFAGRRALDDFTHPSLRLNSGQRAGVALDIEVAGGVARIFVSTLPTVATARLVAPVLGTSGAAPSADERAALDRFGNRNGGYDLGDLRAYMRYRPGTVRPAS